MNKYLHSPSSLIAETQEEEEEGCSSMVIQRFQMCIEILHFVIEFVWFLVESVSVVIRQERLPQLTTSSAALFATTTAVPFVGLLL